MSCQRTIRGSGSSHVGSFRAEKMLYEVKRAAFEETRIRGLVSALGFVQLLTSKLFRRERFSFVICPRADTSTEKKETRWRCERSAIRGEYFSDLKLWLRAMLASHGHVNSKTISIKVKDQHEDFG